MKIHTFFPTVVLVNFTLLSIALGQPDVIHPRNLEKLGFEAPNNQVAFVRGSQPGNVYYPDDKITLKVEVAPEVSGIANISVREITMRENRYYSGDSSAGSTVFGGIPAIEVAEKVESFEQAFEKSSEKRIVNITLPDAFAARYGTYAVSIAMENEKPSFLCTFVRAHDTQGLTDINSPVFGEGQFITHDKQDIDLLRERMLTLRRLGIGGTRIEFGWAGTGPGQNTWDRYDRIMTLAEECGLKFLVTVSGHPTWTMPFGEPTPSASPWKPDHSCLPEYYDDFENWVEEFCRRYWKDGHGALWAIEHWNEPWDGVSISGWESDTLHYRELMKRIASGARKVDPRIKTAAACSSMNTEDKFFSGDDREEMAALIDLFTDHYVLPRNTYGPMVAKFWGKENTDTETWIAATEMLLPQVMCQFLASGQDRVTPWHPAMTYFSVDRKPMQFVMPNPVALSSNVFNAFCSGKPFKKLLFLDHLPWAFQFGEGNDAVIILLGRIHPLTYDATAPRDMLWWQWNLQEGGTMTLDNSDGTLEFYDIVGNREFEGSGTITLPVDYLAHYIKAPKGGSEKIAERLKTAKFHDVRPAEFIVRHFAAPVQKGAVLNLDIHNLLPAKLQGRLIVAPPQGMSLEYPERISLEPGETKRTEIRLTEAIVDSSNSYPFEFRFEAEQGVATWHETVHVLSAKKDTKTIDGNLSDWDEAPGVVVFAGKTEKGMTEKMWMPFLQYKQENPDESFGETKLAWDDEYLYIAARVNSKSPEMGKQRLENWDEDQYFRSAADDATCEKLREYEKYLAIEPWNRDKDETFKDDPKWQEFLDFLETDPEIKAAADTNAARVYLAAKRRNPDITFGDATHVYKKVPWNEHFWRGNTLQLAFDGISGFEHHNIFIDTDRVPAGFHAMPDTDFEFGVYQCLDGAPEIWRGLAPGIPRTHRFPHQPRSSNDQGPVKDGKAVIIRVDTETVYEVAIPWSKLGNWKPEVGKDFGFMFRFTAEEGPSVIFGGDKSASKSNGLTLHPYYQTTPDCGVRWTFVK